MCFDTLITGGTVIDPQQRTAVVADVGITGGRIAAVYAHSGEAGSRGWAHAGAGPRGKQGYAGTHGERRPSVDARNERGFAGPHGVSIPHVDARNERGFAGTHGERRPPLEARNEQGYTGTQGESSPPVEVRNERGYTGTQGESSPPVEARNEQGYTSRSGVSSPPAHLPAAKRVIDATGLVVCPGFIDIHGHVDSHPYSAGLSALQGITTTVGGNCGLSPVDMRAFLESGARLPVNQLELVGHTFSLREAVGLLSEHAYRPATPDQLRAMERMGAKALEEGAAGVSLGLDYAPGSSDAELFAMARLAKRYGRILSVHTRLFTKQDMYSLVEIIRLMRATGVSVQLSHMVYQYREDAVMAEALELCRRARGEGLDLTCDSGMYTAFATFIGTTAYDEDIMDIQGWDYSDIAMVTGSHAGRRLTKALYDEVRKNEPRAWAACVEPDRECVITALCEDYVMPSTDTGPFEPGQGHPQASSTFPKYLRRLVRETVRLSLIEAVRKATLAPAERMGLKTKGRMSPGADADIVIFDPDIVADRGGFPPGQPDAPPEGIRAVLVGGQVVAENGALTGACPGRLIAF